MNKRARIYGHALGRAAAGAAAEGLRALATGSVTDDPAGFAAAWNVASNVPGWFDPVNAAAFWSVIAERRPATTVEIGSYLGRSTALIGLAMKAFSPTPRLVSIDPHTGDRQHMEQLQAEALPTAELFRQHMGSARLLDILDIRVATSVEVAQDWIDPVDLLFIDGWHSYDAVLADSRGWLPHLSADGLVCFDDTGTYAEVRSAVMAACREAALHVYGPVLGQTWAGRSAVVPPALRSPMRLSQITPAARRARF